MTALHLAAKAGQLEICRMILDTGKVTVNIHDDGGWTPLVWSAEFRHLPVVKFLLERGSDPNLRDNVRKILSVLYTIVFSTFEMGSSC